MSATRHHGSARSRNRCSTSGADPLLPLPLCTALCSPPIFTCPSEEGGPSVRYAELSPPPPPRHAATCQLPQCGRGGDDTMNSTAAAVGKTFPTELVCRTQRFMSANLGSPPSHFTDFQWLIGHEISAMPMFFRSLLSPPLRGTQVRGRQAHRALLLNPA